MNEESKKKILRYVPYGLYVIGVKQDDLYHAFTGSFLTQCSFKPPRIAIGVRNASHSLEMMKASGVFSVNFVGKADRKILEQFFKHTPESGSRFGDLAFQLKKTRTPILDVAVAYLECEAKSFHEAGDHTLVVGEVLEAEVVKDEPPLFLSDTPWHYGG